MKPALYAARREEDMPYAVTGLALSGVIALHDLLPYSMPELSFLLIAVLIFLRVSARQSWILVQAEVWTIKRPLRAIQLLHEIELAQIEVVRRPRWRTRLRIVFQRNDTLQYYDLPMNAFDPAKFLRDVETAFPGMLGSSAHRFLEQRERAAQCPSRVVGRFALVGVVLAGLNLGLLHLAPSASFSTQQNITFLTHMTPFVACALVMLPLLVRFFRIRWARPREAWSSVAILLLLYTVYPMAQVWTGGYAMPHIVEASLAGVLVVVAVTGIQARLFPGWAGAGAVVVFTGIVLFAGQRRVQSGPCELAGAFGRMDGAIRDLGWIHGKEPFLYSLEELPGDTLIGTRYTVQGEVLDSIRFVGKPAGRRDLHFVARQLQPLPGGEWLEHRSGYLLLRKPGEEIPDTLWNHAMQQDTSKKAIPGTVAVAPGGRQFLWHYRSNRPLVYGAREDPDSAGRAEWQVKEILLPRTIKLLGWLTDSSFVVSRTNPPDIHRRGRVTLARVSLLPQENDRLDLGVRELETSDVLWTDMLSTPTGPSFTGLSQDSATGPRRYYYLTSGEPSLEVTPPELPEKPGMAMIWALSAENGALACLFKGHGRENRLYILDEGEWQTLEPSPAGFFMDGAAVNDKFVFVFRNGTMIEWWGLAEKEEKRWELTRTTLFNGARLNGVPGYPLTGHRMFSPSGTYFVSPLKSLPDETERRDFAIWRVR